MNVSQQGRPLPGIMAGHGEPIFDALPGNVLGNLRRRSSENALVWNAIYPLARPDLDLAKLLAARPLWGTPGLQAGDDRLRPYFWGYDVEGRQLEGLSQATERVDGPGPSTEIDLLLVGQRNLIAVEAKRGSGFGRCSRYGSGSCPEIHARTSDGEACRYWDAPAARFAKLLEIGERPQPGAERPTCDRHYQLARSLLVGRSLAQRRGLQFHLWLFVPRAAWPRLQRSWQDFADRLRESDQWRRLRVLAWEDLVELSA